MPESGEPDTMQHQHHASPEQAGASVGSFFSDLFESFTPRQQCMNFENDVIWLHIVSDTLIALSYFTIPVALVYFVRRRGDLAFHWMFVLFAAFILLCGATHAFGVWAIWQPLYRLDGVVKLLTGSVSAATAVLLWRLLPTALALPSPAQLRLANEGLEREIAERERAQQELESLARELEERVSQRTVELGRTNEALRAEIRARVQAEEQRNELLESERHARGEAERLNRIKDEFLATLSHELRTPLNAILGWTYLLRQEATGPEERAQALQVIERNARVQTRMIEDLLDSSRITAGKLLLRLEPQDLRAVAVRSIETIAPAAGARRIEVRGRLADVSLPVLGDADRLQQVLANLLSNAVKFTPLEGLVTVETSRRGKRAVLAVEDTGAGIAPELLPHVFDRFRQGDSSSTRPHAGLGLGLAITRSLVELHGGEIRATSAGLGLGARFEIELPLHVPGTPAGESRAASEPLPSLAKAGAELAGLRILVVDDELDARELLRRLLEACGAQVSTAASVAEALAIFESERPRVLISDISMPGRDGYDLIRLIRALPAEQGGDVPAIALTAYVRPEDRQRAYDSGYDVHLGKPVEPFELVGAIAKLGEGRGG